MTGRFALVLSWALVVTSACNNNPVGPTVVTIVPREVAVSPGMNQCFSASGGSDHRWAITGGGQLTPDGSSACVLVGSQAGRYTIKVEAGDAVDEAVFIVYTENKLELYWVGRPSGSSVRMGDLIDFEIKYVNAVREEPVRVSVLFLDKDQKRVPRPGSYTSYMPLLVGVAGVATPASAVYGFQEVIETHFLSLTIVDSATQHSRVYYESIVPYFVRWVP